MLAGQLVTANKLDQSSIKMDDSSQRPWSSRERSLISFSPPPLDQPIGDTVAERIENGPYIKTDVFRRQSAIKQAIKSHHQRQSAMEHHELEGRSKTLMSINTSSDRKHRKVNSLNINLERLHNAKETAERAIKAKKVFTIQGPYSHVREALRRRGWIEKFYKIDPPPKKSPRTKKAKPGSDDSDPDDDDNDDDGDDDDDDAIKEDENAAKPWEEENGIYGIMDSTYATVQSRMARNCAPQFIWCIRRDAIDFRYLRKDQMVNHYGLNGAFTTKVGLCTNLRSSHWYQNVGHETFFPRCYRLSHDEEKGAFTDDYYLTACMGVIRWVILRNTEDLNSDVLSDEEGELSSPPSHHTKSGVEEMSEKGSPRKDENQSTDYNESRDSLPQLVHPSVINKDGKTPRKENNLNEFSFCSTLVVGESEDEEEKKVKKAPRLPMSLLDTALMQCQLFLQFRQNEELEDLNVQEILDIDWEAFLQQYYLLCHNKGIIPGTKSRLEECEKMAEELRKFWPQFDLDGIKNMWIVKPGAKSRGRGIVCYDKLHDMLKLVDSVVRKDSKFVVQKYIERPLLIYKTKFDIRQWFLVTDWNPLTIWWYKDFYVRFCKKNFSLDELDEVIHLSNNSIQKNYGVDPNRSKDIPSDSMWASDDEFQDFLEKRGAGHYMDERIKPGMQQAVICSLLTTRDIVEYRKSSFELYGADFMLTEDYRPWLLEINSSPTLAQNTHVTKRLCQNVVEDTMKVVIDRKMDKNCDTGNFELIYKTTMVAVPQYLGMNLSIEGTSLKTPASITVAPRPRRIIAQETPYQNILPKTDVSQSTTTLGKKENTEKKRKPAIKMFHKDQSAASDASKGKKTPTDTLEKITPTKLDTISENKSASEPNSAKIEKKEGLLLKRKRNAKSVDIKAQLDVMKPTDSYLRKIKEGIDNARKMLKVEPGATEKSFCPKCGSNGIIKLANEISDCTCKQDCIQSEYTGDSLVPFHVRNGAGSTSATGSLNHSAKSRVLKVLQKDASAQLVVPLAPRKLVIKPPDGLPLVASGNMHRFLKVTPGPDTLPYRSAKKTYNRNYKLQKSLPDQTMFVLAESYSCSRPPC